MKKIFFIALAVVVVILVFSLGTFGVETEAVMIGYENTRKYAQDAKMLSLSVDTYKEIVKVKQEDEARREEAVPDNVDTLGAFGELLSDEQYEEYTNGLFISASAQYSPGDSTLSADKPIAAKMHTKLEWSDSTDILNYLTINNEPCNGSSSTELTLYSAVQCAAFANSYMNQIVYDSIVVTGASTASNILLSNYANTYWKANTSVNLNTAEEARNFFADVTPGTFVRTEYISPDKVDHNHSYIILGADDDEIVFYDANSHGNCGILLHRCTWDSFVNNYKSAWATTIDTVISPPNTQLPQGCQDKFGSIGKIMNSKEGS